jgi:hypothetical protein
MSASHPKENPVFIATATSRSANLRLAIAADIFWGARRVRCIYERQLAAGRLIH